MKDRMALPNPLDKPLAKPLADKCAIPWFDHVKLSYFLNNSGESNRCRVPECKGQPFHNCRKLICPYIFCSDHEEHKHLTCLWPGCEKWATFGASEISAGICNDHYRYRDRIRFLYNSRGECDRFYLSTACETCGREVRPPSFDPRFCKNCYNLWSCQRR
jgi:hypothetical protein